MKHFEFKLPQEILFGKGRIQELPDIIRKIMAKKVFLLSDRGLEKAGVVKKITDILDKNNVSYILYLDITPNPTTFIVKEASESYQKSGADCIIALGGGSPMDVAKALAVVSKYGGSITEYEGMDKVPGNIQPIIAIPTTAGTGSEVTPFSVITDEERNYKLTVYSYELLPAYALIDSEMIMSVPAGIAAACGIDALIHAWEAYTSLWANPFTESMAEKAMELIGGHIRRFVANRKDKDAADAMMLGSTFAGIAFAWARTGNVHALSHPVSAYFHVAHGIANAILLPYVVEYNALADNGKYEKMYHYICEGKLPTESFRPSMLVDEIIRLNKALGIPGKLSEVGVTEDRIEAMAQDAMKSGNILVNPRQTTIEDVIDLYKMAL